MYNPQSLHPWKKASAQEEDRNICQHRETTKMDESYPMLSI